MEVCQVSDLKFALLSLLLMFWRFWNLLAPNFGRKVISSASLPFLLTTPAIKGTDWFGFVWLHKHFPTESEFRCSVYIHIYIYTYYIYMYISGIWLTLSPKFISVKTVVCPVPLATCPVWASYPKRGHPIHPSDSSICRVLKTAIGMKMENL